MWVPAFLRALEYFNGIIFMTTNRLGTMDVAFQSRIQVAIEYPTLTESTRRKIWTVFIKRLDNRDSRKEILSDRKFLESQSLNGRQIRNAMKLAQSIAITERNEAFPVQDRKSMDQSLAPLKIRHLRQSIKETLVLEQYFSRVVQDRQAGLGAAVGGQLESRSRGGFEVSLRYGDKKSGRGKDANTDTESDSHDDDDDDEN